MRTQFRANRRKKFLSLPRTGFFDRSAQRPNIEYATRCASSLAFSGRATSCSRESVKCDRSRVGLARFSKALAIRVIWIASSSVTAEDLIETLRSRLRASKNAATANSRPPATKS